MAGLLESTNQAYEAEDEVLWNLLIDIDVNAAFEHPKVFTEVFSLASKENKDEDFSTYVQAIMRPHEEEFRDAMREEIEGLVKRKTWELVPKDSIGKENPQGELLPDTWVCKIKRFTDYTI